MEYSNQLRKSSSGSGSTGAATSAVEEMATTRSTEIVNRIGQPDTNTVPDRIARSDAQHVTRQRLTRNSSTQVYTQL